MTMKNIDTCQDLNCPYMETCYRFSPDIKDGQETKFKYDKRTFKGCSHYWDINHKPKEQILI